jgi:starch synthase
MGPKSIKVLFVCAEVAPFSSVGGLSQVAYFLSRALKKLGVDIRIFTPKYGSIDQQKYPSKTTSVKLKVPTGETSPSSTTPEFINCSIELYQPNPSDVPVYLLVNDEYYQKRANVYNYSDDHIRFSLLSKAAVEFVKSSEFTPDVIHTNDWHTGYLLDYLRRDPLYKDNPQLKRIATLLSIHNIYQGLFDFANASEMDYDDGKSPLLSFFSPSFVKQNSLKRGVMYADVVNTVSETYVRQLLTEEYGGGLENLFRELRGKLYGVLNGLDITDFNPATDKIIKQNFTSKTLPLRVHNKTDLQKHFGLEINPNIPLLSYVGRLDMQKGLDLLSRTLEFMIEELNIQFIALGGGDQSYVENFRELEKKYPGRVGTHLMHDPLMPRKIFAGADAILIPSRYEPGGIIAIEALRYGCIPIARATGGLADSVINFDPTTDTGTGFTFKSFTSEGLLTAVVRAIETFRNKTEWNKIIKRAMSQDFSWNKSAEKYLDLYNRSIEFHRESLSPNPPAAFRPLYS